MPLIQYCRYGFLFNIYLFITFILSGCSWSESVLQTNKILNPQKTYVYGKFALDKNQQVDDKGYYVALQLAYVMESNFEILKYVEFKNKNNIYAVELPPGIYKIKQVTFFKRGMPHKHKELRHIFSNVTLTLEAGKAYYIGDYSGWAQKEPPQDWSIVYSWRFDTLQHQFSDTTEALTTRYPNFSSIEKIDLYKSITQPVYSGIYNELRRADALLIEKQYQGAASIFKRFAHDGVPYAQLKYGQMHENGQGVPASPYTAGQWYKKSADLGNTNAMLHLGQLLITNSPLSQYDPAYAEWLKLGDRNQGIALIEKSAARGNIQAMVKKCALSSFETIDGEALAKNYAWCEVGFQNTTDSRRELRNRLLERTQQARSKMDKLTKRMARRFLYMYRKKLKPFKGNTLLSAN